MIDEQSRYADLETATYVPEEGAGEKQGPIAYKRRRFLPRPEDLPRPDAPGVLAVAVAEGDRLDLIAARALGDPLLFWRVCDAACAMRPDELLDEVGRILRVPLPGTEPWR